MISRGVTLLVGSLIACGGGRVAPAGAGGDAVPTVVHVDDDGKSFELVRGETLTFELASRGGTGYAWMPTHFDPLVFAQEGERSAKISSALAGAEHMDVYRFRAVQRGSSTVEMSLRRPFGGADPVRTIHVTIQVH